MDKNFYYTKFTELVKNSKVITSKDCEAVLKSIVNHYDMALVGNLLFIRFVGNINEVREVSTSDKTIIEIPIRSEVLSEQSYLIEKWEKILKEDFHVNLTNIDYWVVTEEGLSQEHAYAVLLRRFPWIGFIDDNLSGTTDRITKKIVYNDNFKKKLEKEICGCIKAVTTIEDSELNSFLIGLSERMEEIVKFGVRVQMGFADEGFDKPTFIKKDNDEYWTVKVPSCRFDKYTYLLTKTLRFCPSDYDKTILYPSPSMMAEIITTLFNKE